MSTNAKPVNRHSIFLGTLLLLGVVALATVVSRGLQPTATQSAIGVAEAASASAAGSALASPASAASPLPTSILPDAVAGKTVAAACQACHTFGPGAPAGVGPSLYGIVNRAVAAQSGYDYSVAMRTHAKATPNWTPRELERFLKDVQGTVPGSKMVWPGVAVATDRANLLAYLASNAEQPVAASELGLETAVPAAVAVSVSAASAASGDPAPASADEQAREAAAVRALEAALPGLDYQRARYHPLHFKPAIDRAYDGECLVCHREILSAQVRKTSPAGLAAADALAWYQTLATYDGAQLDFHQRHINSPYARAVMNLKCNFCHQGNDPRDESPVNTVAIADRKANNGKPPFTNRKMVNPSESCLRCHGAMPDPKAIMGLAAAWPEARATLESSSQANGCLTCHAVFRTVRHRVSYLNAQAIENLAEASSDVCYGCHGGRAWYRTSYPYPRHAWPGMAAAAPAWATDRPTQSDPRYRIDARP